MVKLFINGKPVGNWAEAEKVFAETARTQAVEFRDEENRVIATSIPGAEPMVPWDPTVTAEERDRRLAGEFIPFEEVKKRLGWE